MGKQFYNVRAAEGRRVREPGTRRVLSHETPTRVEWSTYWQRRHRDRDIELVEDEPVETETRKARKRGEE